MMHPRWLALPLAAIVGSASITGCASITGYTPDPGPRLLSPDLHVGTLDQRTRFELDDQGSGAAEREAPDDEGAPVDTPKQQRRRKLLYLTGLGALGFGAVGFTAFGLGGRIVQAQLRNGYDDADLMRDREEQLQTTGKVMNGLAIGSAVVGILGLITAATVYGIDHARCGDLRPRRKDCPDRPVSASEPGPSDAAPSDAAPSDAAPSNAAPEVGPAPASPAPTGASDAPAPASPAPASPGGTPSPGAAAGR